ncbi:MAG TPA: large conductance mechanosensitive channel protein MscL [Candidatus Dormibacteraeota bacterium]|nr:large conductance mechanosensitive channel protein MscL [Candidatus Dormibacteraeota bacterium]
MIREFRDFLLRGNVIDLAVAVVIGVAFGAVVNSFVVDVLTPLLGIIGVPSFSKLGFTTPNGAFVGIGLFLNALIYFVLVTAAIFFAVVRPMNAMAARRAAGERGEEPGEEPTTKACPFCATDIPVAATRCPHCTSPLS